MSARWIILIAIPLIATACGGGASRRVANEATPTAPAVVDTVAATPTPTAAPALSPQPTGTAFLPNGDIAAFDIIDANRGWAIRTSLEKPWNSRWVQNPATVIFTNDGGSTWTETAELPFTPELLDFADSQRGWAAGPYLLATEDGGQTWEPRSHIRTDSISFVSPQVGWVTTRRGYLSTTTDGGRSWISLGDPCAGFWHGYVSFIDESRGWLLCVLGTGGGYAAKLLLHTRDGGHTWDQLADATYVNSDHGALGPGGYVSDMYFGDVNRGWIAICCLVVASAIETVDGGSTWSDTTYPGSRAAWMRTPRFSDSLHGWLIAADDYPLGPGTLYRTTDGGETWVAIDVADTLP